MNYNENMSEALCLIAHKPSVAATATTYAIGPFTMRTMRRILFILDIGTLANSATINFSVAASNASGGTFTTIPGTTITQYGASPTTAGLITVEVKAETVAATALNAADANAAVSASTLPGPWVKGVLVVGAGTTPLSVLVIGEGGYYPASDYVGEDTGMGSFLQANVIQQLVA